PASDYRLVWIAWALMPARRRPGLYSEVRLPILRRGVRSNADSPGGRRHQFRLVLTGPQPGERGSAALSRRSKVERARSAQHLRSYFPHIARVISRIFP